MLEKKFLLLSSLKGGMKIDIKNLKYEPYQVNDIIGIKGFQNKTMVSFIADERKGILPHEIPNGSFIFVRPDDDYEINDFIVVYRDKRTRKDYRIKKAEEKEPLYFGRIIMIAKCFIEEDV